MWCPKTDNVNVLVFIFFSPSYGSRILEPRTNKYKNPTYIISYLHKKCNSLEKMGRFTKSSRNLLSENNI